MRTAYHLNSLKTRSFGMASHATHRLSARGLDKLPPGRHGDGHGLMLYVKPSGTRSWVQRLIIQGERVDLGIGGYPLVGLREARERAFANRQIARRGDDPRRARVPTFREAQERLYAEKPPTWSATARHADKWRNTMREYVLPKIAAVPVDRIESYHVKRVLLPLAEAGKLDQTARVGNRISQVLDWAVLEGYRDRENPCAVVVKALRPAKVDRTGYRALPHAEVAGALRAVDGTRVQRVTKLALRFTVLTAARSIEVRRMAWADVDLSTATWNRPADKMKTGEAHRVALSAAAVAVLQAARDLPRGRSRLVFATPAGRMLPENALRRLLDRAGVASAPHGFRASFRTWCAETGVDRELAERCLAHAFGSDVEQAYQRGDLLERRRPVMARWADHVGAAAEQCTALGTPDHIGRRPADRARRGSTNGASAARA